MDRVKSDISKVYYTPKFDNLFLVDYNKDGIELEEWYRNKDPTNIILNISKEVKGQVLGMFLDKRIGESLGWRYNERTFDMHIKSESRQFTAELYQKKFRESMIDMLMQEWWNRKQAEEVVKRYNNDPNALTVVKIIDGTVVSYGNCLVDYDEKTAWIEAVYTHNKYRKKGFGVEVCNSLISKLHEKDIKDIYIGVEESNIGAVKLYEKVGFKIVNIRGYQFKRN